MKKSPEEYPLLVAQEGPLKGQRWQLSQTIVLGRESSCDVVVADRQISRFHARITPTTEGVILEVGLDYRVRVNRKHPWRVRYEYQAGGSPYVGSEITWEKPDAYEPGAKVAVVYDAAKVYRSALKRPRGEV